VEAETVAGQEGRSVRVDAERRKEAARSGKSAEEEDEEEGEEVLVPWASSIEAKKAGLFIGSRECMRL
jgi:hypothetical protein